jgi:hypothetical protein
MISAPLANDSSYFAKNTTANTTNFITVLKIKEEEKPKLEENNQYSRRKNDRINEEKSQLKSHQTYWLIVPCSK